MTRVEKLKKIGDKYGINIIASSNNMVIYELNGYIHNISKNDISRTKLDNPSSMTSKSYMDYLNNTVFNGTELEVIDIDGDYIIYINNKTKECSRTSKYNIDINRLINITSKIYKYRDAIIKIHGDKYNYDNCWPENITDKVELECPVHGKFFVSVNNIIHNNTGCPGCANELKGYSKTVFRKSCIKNNNGLGLIYVALIENDDEKFIKIGITSYNNTENRFRELNKIYDKVTPILEMASDPDRIYNLEHKLHKKYFNYKYLPLLGFNGRQECYNINILEDVIKNIRIFL